MDKIQCRILLRLEKGGNSETKLPQYTQFLISLLGCLRLFYFQGLVFRFSPLFTPNLFVCVSVFAKFVIQVFLGLL